MNVSKPLPYYALLAFVLLATLSFPDAVYSQTNWVKYPDNPVMVGEPGTSREDVFFPAAIFHEDMFKLYYNGWGSDGLRHIFYSESDDGINWWNDPDPVLPATYPYGWDKQKLPCTVLWVDDTMRLWYSGSVNWWQFSIGYAWSLDGIAWNKYIFPVMIQGEAGSWDSEYVMWPAVIYDEGLYHMWYTGSDNWWDDYIFYARSRDGITWEKHPDPVIMNGPDGSYHDRWVESCGAVKYNDTIHLYFNGFDGDKFRIGYAWSTDYYNWEVSDTAIIDVGEAGEWDEDGVGTTTVLVHEGQLKMWHGGQRFTDFGIGYATGDSIWNPSTGTAKDFSDASVDIEVYPNPCSGVVHLRYAIFEMRNPKCEIFTIDGVKVMTLLDQIQEAGEHELTFDISDLPAGMYLLVMQSGNGRQVKKIVKTGGGR
jgi:predicted GH43/DUF377 family glycosyl hydrolase